MHSYFSLKKGSGSGYAAQFVSMSLYIVFFSLQTISWWTSPPIKDRKREMEAHGGIGCASCRRVALNKFHSSGKTENPWNAVRPLRTPWSHWHIDTNYFTLMMHDGKDGIEELLTHKRAAVNFPDGIGI